MVSVSLLRPPAEPQTRPRKYGTVLFLAPGLPGSWTHKLKSFVLDSEWSCAGPPLPWVILLACFEVHTGAQVSPHRTLQDRSLRPKVDCREAIGLFRSRLLSVVRLCVHPEDRGLFRVVSTGTHAGNALGWKGFASCMVSWPRLPDHVYDRVTKSLVGMRTKLPEGWSVSYTHLTLPTICSV
eukprot:4201934-Alexandrium_andersonii.AAC.1